MKNDATKYIWLVLATWVGCNEKGSNYHYVRAFSAASATLRTFPPEHESNIHLINDAEASDKQKEKSGSYMSTQITSYDPRRIYVTKTK